ncbi:MAG: HPr family phosphocarrier protein, partial [Rhodocyclaceae bacterium]|nr:HPr family phosphocarrier protein [Rhodocyclaceae bacterium]
MMLAAGCGSSIVVDTQGEQAEDALGAIRELVIDRFGEDE